MNIKHYVGKTEYATVVEVLNEIDAATALGYDNNNYSGTAVYAHMMDKRAEFGQGFRVGVNIFYPKHKIEVVAKRYINKGDIKESIKTIVAYLMENPESISALLKTAKSK